MSKKKGKTAAVGATTVRRNGIAEDNHEMPLTDHSMGELFGQVCTEIYRLNQSGGHYAFEISDVCAYAMRFDHKEDGTEDCAVLAQFYRSQFEGGRIRECLGEILEALRKEGGAE